MSEHYTITKVSKKDLVNAFELSESEAKLIHKYRNQLPAIIDADGDDDFCVNMRELHKQLKVQTDFDKWCKRRLKSFSTNFDFSTFLAESTGGRPRTEYLLNVDTAKQVAMMEGSEVGQTVRKYFVLCEKLVIRMAKRNPIRQNCKDSTKMMANNIALRVPAKKLPIMMQELNSAICTIATGARPSAWRKTIGVDNVRDFLKENSKVSELKRYDEVAQMAEMLSRDLMQTKKSIIDQLKRTFGDSEIYFNYLYANGVKEF